MASLGHVAVGMAAARLGARGGSRARLALAMALWSALSLLPDADVIGFRFGIAYTAPWGHRGATHSLGFALLGGAAIGLAARRAATGALASVVLASHGLLDALTDGGLGCALLWPWSDERFFAPWRPLAVAPLGLRIFSPAGLEILARELVIFGPLLLYALWPRNDRQKPAP
jgi:inner membrane protein